MTRKNMKGKQRIIALILTFVLLLSGNGITNVVLANEINNQESSATIEENENLNVEGTNSFGSLLTEVLENELDEQEENNGNNIFSIEIQETTAIVSFETTETATIVVAIYDEAGNAMFALGNTEVTSEEKVAYVEIDTETMPEFYYVKGFLIEKEYMRPLCSAYESSLYTQEMQEFLAKTTDDFDAERVLNFDGDKTNNFAVYSEKTIIIPKDEDKNKVVLNDEENNTYVIENIDTHISSLKSGDVFAYEYEAGNILIAKVASLSIDGTTVTIIGEDTSMEEVFEYVKIDETSDSNDITVDASTCGEGVTYVGKVEVKNDEDIPQTYVFEDKVEVEGEGSIKYEHKFSIEKGYSSEDKDEESSEDSSEDKDEESSEDSSEDKDEESSEDSSEDKDEESSEDSSEDNSEDKDEDSNQDTNGFEVSRVKPELEAEVSGSVGIQIEGVIKYYLSLEKQYLEVNLDYSIGVEVSVSGKITPVSFQLGRFHIMPLTGVSIEFTPTFIMEASGGIEANGQLGGTVGFKVSSQDGMKNLTSNPKVEIKVEGEVELFIGISMNPKVVVISEKIANASLEIITGGTITANMEYGIEWELGTETENIEKIHECKHCIEGSTGIGVNVEFSVNLLNIDKLTFNYANEWSIEGPDFYYSIDYGEFAFTTCPHCKYQVTFIVKDVYENEIKNASIKLKDKVMTILNEDGEEEKAELFTDASGKVSCYLSGGDYEATIDTNEWDSQSKNFDIDDEPIKVCVLFYLEAGENDTEEDGSNLGEDEDVETIVVGKNTFVLDNGTIGAVTENGNLYMWGENANGRVGNGTTEDQLTPIKVLDNVREVVLNCDMAGAIKTDGSLYMWGDNRKGEVGNGTTENQLTPIKVLDNVVQVVGCYWTIGAITEDGSLYMWGDNENGQLGNGTMDSLIQIPVGNETTRKQLIPTKVLDNVQKVVIGNLGRTVGAITEDGSLYMWGYNRQGQVGNGTTENQLTPVKVLDSVQEIVIHNASVGAVTEDGSLYKWGENGKGQVGNGTTEDQLTPIKVLDNVQEVLLDYGAITEDGSLYMWGDNDNGLVGNGTTEDQLIPIKIFDNVQKVVHNGYARALITTDGSLYMWGRNDNGRVGNGTTKDQLTPIKILNNVKDVVLELIFSSDTVGAITENGNLYMWGHGVGATPEKKLNNVKKIVMDSNTVGAITEDGSLYMWGSNRAGEVGNGTTSQQFIPTKVTIKTPETVQSTYTNAQSTALNTYSARNIISETTFTDLLPNEIYNFYTMKDRNTKNPLNSSNLLYITQAVTDEEGNLTISYTPTEQAENADIFVVQMTQTDLSSAQVELKDLEYTGELQYVNPKVTLDGTVLVEGKDYELVGDYSAIDKGEYIVTVQGIGLYTGEIHVSYKIISSASASNMSISGTITSATTTDDITIQLLDSTDTVAYTTTITGDSTSYSFSNIQAGMYTMKVTKANHVEQEYTIDVRDKDIVQDIKLCLFGDVNGDGKVTATDYSRLLAHVKKTSIITDAYTLLCADVNKDNKITATDYSRLLAHVKKVSPLW